MNPTVEQVLDQAAFHLGDANGRTFTHDKLTPGFKSAFQEIIDHLLIYQIPTIEYVTLYTLAANTASLSPGVLTGSPSVALISNFGELIKLEEKPSGSNEDYTEVVACGELPQTDPQDKLYQYKWRGDTFYFVAANRALDLRITYYGSGDAPTTGSVGIDNSLNFLAKRTAAIYGKTAGMIEVASDLDKEARGPALDGSGGDLHRLLQPMVRARNKIRIQMPAYRAGGGAAVSSRGGVPYLASE